MADARFIIFEVGWSAAFAGCYVNRLAELVSWRQHLPLDANRQSDSAASPAAAACACDGR